MKENIGDKSYQLNNLFESVRRDTPEMTRDELRKLIATREPSSAPVSMRHNTTLLSRKGIVMSLITTVILGIVYLAIQPSHNESLSIQPTVERVAIDRAKNVVSDTQNGIERRNNVAASENKLQEKKQRVIDPKQWERFVRKPIDMSLFHVTAVDPDRFPSLGLWQTDSGAMIYYHNYLKIGFPMQDYISLYFDGKDDPRSPILSARPYYPEYVTDNRGNMMMHYITYPVQGGHKISLNVTDQDIAGEIRNLPYYGIPNTTRTIVLSDAEKDILKIRLVVKAGIMQVDTVLTGKKSDQRLFEQSQREIEADCRSRDSVLKAGLGGMSAVATDFAFDLSDSTDPLVKQVLSIFGAISKKGKSEIKILSEKISAMTKLLETEPTVEAKLRLEQLLIRLYDEATFEQTKQESTEIQNSVDLIPVLVRPETGVKANPRFDNGLIFWYRDSDTLREVLNLPQGSVASNDGMSKLSVLPNPARENVYIDYEMKVDGPLRISLVELTGKQLYSDAWKSGGKVGRKTIDVRSVAPGIYMLVIDTEQGRAVRQVIVRH